MFFFFFIYKSVNEIHAFVLEFFNVFPSLFYDNLQINNFHENREQIGILGDLKLFGRFLSYLFCAIWILRIFFRIFETIGCSTFDVAISLSEQTPVRDSKSTLIFGN